MRKKNCKKILKKKIYIFLFFLKIFLKFFFPYNQGFWIFAKVRKGKA